MNNFLNVISFLTVVTSSYVATSPNPPDCSGSERWPASMVQVELKNEFNVSVAAISRIDVERIANEQLDNEVHRQVHDINVMMQDGKQYQAVTVHDASHEECSMSGVKIYWVESTNGALY